MINRKRLFYAPALLMLAALACNAPTGQSSQDTSGAAATITALAATLQAQSAAGSAAIAESATVTPTPTGAAPTVTVSQATNCRTGPGTAYDQVGALSVGQSAQVVGKYTPANYLIILVSNGSCWLWGQYATVNGDLSGIPEVPPPPTPTPHYTATPKPTRTPTIALSPTEAPPNAPSSFTYNRTCAGGFRGATPIWIEAVTLSWQDNANNEDGYYMYKNGTRLPALSAGSTSYNITLRYDQGTGGALYDTFGVEAFNGAGASGKAQLDVPTCP